MNVISQPQTNKTVKNLRKKMPASAKPSAKSSLSSQPWGKAHGRLQLFCQIGSLLTKTVLLVSLILSGCLMSKMALILSSVIPYIQLQKLRSDHAELQQAYANAGYQVHDSMGDIYALFYELGYCLLKWRTGILAYITSNKWMRAGYGKKLRDFFNIHTDPIKLIDFAGQRVFTTATVDVNIMIFRKSKLGTPTQATTVKEDCLNVLGIILTKLPGHTV